MGDWVNLVRPIVSVKPKLGVTVTSSPAVTTPCGQLTEPTGGMMWKQGPVLPRGTEHFLGLMIPQQADLWPQSSCPWETQEYSSLGEDILVWEWTCLNSGAVPTAGPAEQFPAWGGSPVRAEPLKVLLGLFHQGLQEMLLSGMVPENYGVGSGLWRQM